MFLEAQHATQHNLQALLLFRRELPAWRVVTFKRKFRDRGCSFLQRLVVNPGMGGRNETLKQRMGLVRFALELGMKLAGDEEGVFRVFNDLDQFSIRCVTAENKTGFLESLTISVVELVTVAMTLVHHKGAVKPGGFRADYQLAGLGA
jgi:hypothetical protein